MKTVFYVSMVSMILFAGCSSVHLVEYDESSYIETSKKIEGKQASITLASNEKIRGKDIILTLDSTSWVDSNPKSWVDLKSKVKQIVPTSEVKEIAIRNHGKGALLGLGLGIIGGAGIGFIVGSTVETKNEPRADYQFGWTALCAPIGGVLGLAIGALKGTPEKYVLKEPTIRHKKHN